MITLMTLAGLAVVTVLSFGVALGIEWLCLHGAFLLLPHANAKLRLALTEPRRAPAARLRVAHRELSRQV